MKCIGAALKIAFNYCSCDICLSNGKHFGSLHFFTVQHTSGTELKMGAKKTAKAKKMPDVIYWVDVIDQTFVILTIWCKKLWEMK